MVKDVRCLLMEGEDDASLQDEVKLWNGTAELVANGINYSGSMEEGDAK